MNHLLDAAALSSESPRLTTQHNVSNHTQSTTATNVTPTRRSNIDDNDNVDEDEDEDATSVSSGAGSVGSLPGITGAAAVADTATITTASPTPPLSLQQLHTLDAHYYSSTTTPTTTPPRTPPPPPPQLLHVPTSSSSSSPLSSVLPPPPSSRSSSNNRSMDRRHTMTTATTGDMTSHYYQQQQQQQQQQHSMMTMMNHHHQQQQQYQQPMTAYMAPPPPPEPPLSSTESLSLVMEGLQPPGDRPKRPLSAYNFFFQLERDRIVSCDTEEERNADTVVYTAEDVVRVARVQQAKLADTSPKEKRSHRKTHGKISFADLARTIANRWKKLDDAAKTIFEGSAAVEKTRYKNEVAEWNKQQKKWKEAASKMAICHQEQQQQQQQLHSAQQRQQQAAFIGDSTVVGSRSTMHIGSSCSNIGGGGGNGNGALVTPTQHPKMTISSMHPSRMDNGSSPFDDSMNGRPMNEQQYAMSTAHMLQQRQRRRLMAVAAAHHQHRNNRLAQSQFSNRRFSTGMMASSNYHPPYDMSHAQGGASAMDFGATDMHNGGGGGNLYDMDDEYDNGNNMMMHDMINSNNGGGGGDYDYDDVAEETFQRAQMMLSQQRLQHPSSHGGYNTNSNSSHQHRRAMLHQRKMHLMALMRQNEQMAASMNGVNDTHGTVGVNLAHLPVTSSALRNNSPSAMMATQQRQHMQMMRQSRVASTASDAFQTMEFNGGFETMYGGDVAVGTTVGDMEPDSHILAGGGSDADVDESYFMNGNSNGMDNGSSDRIIVPSASASVTLSVCGDHESKGNPTDKSGALVPADELPYHLLQMMQNGEIRGEYV